MEHILACPKCSGANRWGQLFCRFCGQNLAHKCVHCHVDVDPSMGSCPYCGETVATWSIVQGQANEEPFTNPKTVLELS